MENEKRFYVYGYFEPDSEVPFYIGKGQGDRAYKHLWPSFLKRKSPLYCKLRGMLARGIQPRVEILHSEIGEAESLRLEVRLIAEHGRKDLGTGILCNLTDGGDGLINPSAETRAKMSVNLGKSPSTETLAKMSASQTGRKATDATRKKLSAAKAGTVLSDEWRAKIGAGNTGKVRTPEFRAAVSATHKGSKHTVEACENMSIAQRAFKGRAVQSTDPRTGEIKVYEIVSDVLKDGYSQGNVSECCMGNRVTHKGLLWDYCDQPILRDPAREAAAAMNNRRSGRGVVSTDPRTGETKFYTFMNDVKKAGFSQGNVGQCCRGTRKMHKGLTWSYVDAPPRPDDCGEN